MTEAASPILWIDDLPELETQVGLAGALHQAEVGGSVCFHTAITIAIITDGGG